MSDVFAYHPLDVKITAEMHEFFYVADFVFALWGMWWGVAVEWSW